MLNNIRIGNKIKGLGLPSVIFDQAFLRTSEKQNYYLRDLLTYALLNYRTDGVYKQFIYKLSQGPSKIGKHSVVLPIKETIIKLISNQFNDSITVI
jgi:hypothetical protein